MNESWKLYTLIIKKAGELVQQNDVNTLRKMLNVINSKLFVKSGLRPKKDVRIRGISTPVKQISDVLSAKHPDINLFNERKNARKSSKVIEEVKKTYRNNKLI